ncbi:MAG TPA: hypothetical protein VHE12_05250 [bacterium]|nr:hypothetical protein [bacterium]
MAFQRKKIRPFPAPLDGLPAALFILAFFLLGHRTLSGPWPWALVLGGIVLPFLFLLGRASRSVPDGKTLVREEFFFPSWVPALLLAVAVLLRFWRLDTLAAWPSSDEETGGYLAEHFGQMGVWKGFFGGQIPAPWIWACAAVWRISHDSFLTTWFPAAMSSLLIPIAAVPALRIWTTRGQGWLLGSLLAVSYWPLYLGRTGIWGVWLPAWECMAVYFLGKYSKTVGPDRRVWAVILGFWTASGYWTFPSFAPVSLALVIGFLLVSGRSKRAAEERSIFLAAGALAVVPLAWEWTQGRVGGHILSVGFWKGPDGSWQVLDSLGGYLRILFGGDGEGGYFNPLLGALFLTGLAVLYRARRAWLYLFLAVFFLFLAPGYLSMNMEPYRVVSILPWVLWAAALGLRSFLVTFPTGWRVPLLLSFLAVSGGMDWRQLNLPYRNIDDRPDLFRGTGKSIERYRAYRILREQVKEQGPGVLFPDFCPDDSFDLSFIRAASSLGNAGTSTSVGKARWAAALTNLHYRPFLDAGFPDARWYVLGKERSGGGPSALMLLPLGEKDRPRIEGWLAASVCFDDIERARFLATENEPAGKVLEEAFRHYPLVLRDPYLVSCFWERMASLFYYFLGHPPRELETALRRSVQGYPAAHLYYRLGALLLRLGKLEEARWAFQEAERAPLNLCPTAEALALVAEREAAEGEAGGERRPTGLEGKDRGTSGSQGK